MNGPFLRTGKWLQSDWLKKSPPIAAGVPVGTRSKIVLPLGYALLYEVKETPLPGDLEKAL